MTDTRLLITIALLFLVAGIVLQHTDTPLNKQQKVNAYSISIPATADAYEVKTTIVHGITATVYYTSYTPTSGTYMTLTIFKNITITTKTVFWHSNGTWYYYTANILHSTTSFQKPPALIINMHLSNNVLIVYWNGTTYTPVGPIETRITVFTMTNSNTTIEVTLNKALFVPLLKK